MVALPLRTSSAPDADPTTDGPAADATTTSVSRPALELIQNQRRWPAMLIGAVLAVVFGALLGIAVFHTQLAGRQLEIDRLEQAVNVERERFDDLRHDRAVLRSPARLDEAAESLMMVRGASSKFIRITPDELAVQLAAAGVLHDDPVEIIVAFEPLEQFRDVKAVSAGQP